MANGRTGLVIKPVTQLVQRLQSLYQKPPETIRGLNADSWYSPLQPVQPLGPPGTEPRGFQIWAGQNLIYTPRADAEFTAADLKALATYPLARICIENVKDTVTRAPWEIQMRARPTESRKDVAARAKENKDDLIKLNRFFEYPDREHNWQEWLRPLLDDLLVIDAPAILLSQTFKGDIVELPVIRGEMIVRYIDQNGFTPTPPSPAYAQNWWGLPLVNLTTNQLVYKPRNIVPRNTLASQLYGMSPCEQLAPEIQVGTKRLQFVLAYYCYSDDTEVLTKRGWLKFQETNETDDFATRQIQTGIFEWQKAYDTFYKHYDGEMIHFKGQSLDLLVTPNHRMLVDSLPRALGKGKPHHKKEFVIEADALAEVYSGRTGIPQWSVWHGTEIAEKVFRPTVKRSGPDPLEVRMTGDQYCAFMGMYLAEGSIRRRSVQIHQPKDKRGAHELYRMLLKAILRLEPNFSVGRRFEFQRRVLIDFLKQFGHAHEKFIPDDIRNAPARQLELFWRYYWMGDGSASGSEQIFTVSKKLADQITEIIQKMGSASTTWTRKAYSAKFPGGRISRTKIGWMVTRRKGVNVKLWNATRVPYSGPVCCVCVPNKFLYVRRNGKTAWSGNTEGSVPGVVQVVPRGTSPDRIEEAMEWMNSQLAGNLAKRNQWRLVQGFNEPGKAEQIIFSKEPLLAGLYDEKHIREIAYGFGTSPQRLMKMIRTEGKSSADAAEIEGTLPWVLWVKGIIDFIIQRKMGFPDYEIAINPYAEPDPLKNAAALTMLVSKAVLTPNEARKRVGEELRPEPEADQVGVITGTGFIPVGVAPATAGLMVDEKGAIHPHPVTPTPPQKPASNGDHNAARGGTPISQEAGGGRSTGRNVGIPSGNESLDGKKKIAKRLGSRIEPDVLTPESQQAVHQIQQTLQKVFQAQSATAIARSRFHKTLGNALSKRKYGNVQFNLSAADAQRVLELPVDGAHLAAKGRDMQPHVTVLFGFHPEVTSAQINKITKGLGDVDITIEGLEAFPEGEDGVPLVVRVESDKLRKLHEDLKILPHTETWPEYKPHFCVAYLKSDAPAQEYVNAGNPLAGEIFTLTQLVHSGVDYTMSDLEKLMLPSERIRRFEKRKFTKKEVDFEHPASGMDHCADCTHFLKDAHACKIVAGKVLAGDWCQKFYAK
jgi:hypothetical protein